jgi:hypothetical protein
LVVICVPCRPCPSPMSATFTSALRAMVAPGNHLGSPLGKATPKEPKPIRLLVKRKRIIAGGFGNSM